MSGKIFWLVFGVQHFWVFGQNQTLKVTQDPALAGDPGVYDPSLPCWQAWYASNQIYLERLLGGPQPVMLIQRDWATGVGSQCCHHILLLDYNPDQAGSQWEGVLDTTYRGPVWHRYDGFLDGAHHPSEWTFHPECPSEVREALKDF